MEGGIGIFLLLVILLLVVGGVVFLYVTGGAMFASRSGDDDADGGSRPLHKTPSDPAQSHTHLVGTPEGDAAARREKSARAD